MTKISSQIFEKIRRIQFYTTRLVNDILAGAYRSAFKGRGMEFEEVREYQMGDEVRTVDWNVTARMNRPYVKIYREEREITMTLVVDVSASTHSGSGNQLKSDLIAEIAAILAFSAIKNNDKVSLVLFSDRVEKYFPPAKGVRHVLRVIRELLVYVPKHQGTDIGAALTFLGNVQQNSGICFLISDFICKDYSHEAALAAKKNDLIGMALVDKFERQPIDLGLVNFYDLESQWHRLVDTGSKKVQEQMEQYCSERLEVNKTLMRKAGADFLVIHTEQSYLTQLRKFFLMRQMRRR